MAVAEVQRSERPAARVWRRFARRRTALVSLAILVGIAVATVGAEAIAPYSAGRTHPSDVLAAPGRVYLLGTDTLGRDTLSQMLYGGRVTLAVGVSVALLATFGGTLVGMVAGYFGGAVDAVLMRLTDTLLALPGLLVVMMLARMLGDGIVDVVAVLSLLGWMAVARIIRGRVLGLRELEFVAAAQAMGASRTRVMLGHLLPNLVGEIAVAVSLAAAAAILAESVLSFLGFGVSPAHTPTWGNMLGGNEGFMTVAPWLVIPPGAAIALTVLCVNFVGDGLRDAFDVRSDSRGGRAR
ncbi:ABC transporter permease [Candidatus Poriferisodalis sp.]|uniref:ABC transporter permease n=1 Tax=Candidatus Poriferisodalis sp. TaxID=3101277 RepID=UPI003B02C9BF